jgi:hypothetical protein
MHTVLFFRTLLKKEMTGNTLWCQTSQFATLSTNQHSSTTMMVSTCEPWATPLRISVSLLSTMRKITWYVGHFIKVTSFQNKPHTHVSMNEYVAVEKTNTWKWKNEYVVTRYITFRHSNRRYKIYQFPSLCHSILNSSPLNRCKVK